jgi:hypothetical protein
MRLTNVKAMAAKVMTVGLLAGAVALAVPAKAEAQQFVVGARFGAPAYRYDYYDRGRFERERRREEFIRHEEWVRAHEFRRGYYGYGRY